MFIHIVQEPLETIATPPTTLGDLCRDDKFVVILMAGMLAFLAAKPWFDQRRRKAGIATARNVVSIKKEIKL